MPEFGRPTKPTAKPDAKPTWATHQPEAQDLDPVRSTTVPNKGRNASGVATVLDPRRPPVERSPRKSKQAAGPQGLLEKALNWVRPQSKGGK